MNAQTTLGDVCTFVSGSVFPQSEQGASNGDLPFAKVKDLGSASGSSWPCISNWITYAQQMRLKASLIPEGSVVFAKIGEGLRRNRFAVAPREMVIDNNMMAALPDPRRVDRRWFLHLLEVLDLAQFAVGTALPYLRQSDLKAISFEMPPLATQRAIAEVLGALDDKIAANRQFMETASELQQAMWARSTRDVTRVALAEVADIHLGGTPPRGDASAWDGNVAWASVRDMSAAPGGVILETSEHISRASADRVRRLTDLPPGSTFISARGTVGLVTTNAIPCAINQSAYALLARDVSPVGLRLAVAELGDYLRARAHGSVFDTITTETLNESLIPDLRDPSVRAIEPSIENLEAIRIAHARENQVLASTRDELLPLLMSGRITVGAASSRVEEVV